MDNTTINISEMIFHSSVLCNFKLIEMILDDAKVDCLVLSYSNEWLGQI